MNRRGGYLLIEMVTAMATGAALMSIATGLLFMLARSEEVARENLRASAAQGRLIAQFRQDAHAATTWHAEQGQNVWHALKGRGCQGEGQSLPLHALSGRATRPSWRLDLDGGRSVVYQLRDGGLLRTETKGSTTVTEEIYRLPRHAQVSIERRADGGYDYLRLRISSGTASTGAPVVRPAVIDAALGADLRLVRASQEP